MIPQGKTRFVCACCDEPFWAAEATFKIYCNPVTGMPVEQGTYGAQLRPVGECCAADVEASLIREPPPDTAATGP